MTYFNFICSIICLSLASNIYAAQNVISNTHVCPVTGIVWEEAIESRQTRNNERVNIKKSPICLMGRVMSHNNHRPMSDAIRDPALVPYDELVGPIQTLDNVKLRIPKNEIINQIDGIINYLGILTNDRTTICCNRITTVQLGGENEQIIIAGKKWQKRCETKNVTLGALQPIMQNANNHAAQVTYIQLNNGKCGILLELDGILDGNQQRTIRHIQIEY